MVTYIDIGLLFPVTTSCYNNFIIILYLFINKYTKSIILNTIILNTYNAVKRERGLPSIYCYLSSRFILFK